MSKLFTHPAANAIADYAWGVGYVHALLAVARGFEQDGLFPLVVAHHRNVARKLLPLNRQAWQELERQLAYSRLIKSPVTASTKVNPKAKRARKVKPAA
jgi:hypothetical protein